MTSKAKIFLVAKDSDQLIQMDEQAYLQEVKLQELLALYPDLLPGDQINPENPRRWLLVSREMGVPGSEEESGRWSLDHLFLDQDGIPTFVECKRATDTRIRREVVAQMLDYAANGIEYWNIKRLRQEATETATDEGSDLDDLVAELIDGEDETAVETFWASVEKNLQQGNIRLIFVADSIPRELRRLVEFLNDKMNDVEVLAVEVKRFQGEEHTVLVPRVVGLTEAARDKKKTAKASKPLKSLDEFLELCPRESRPFLRHAFDVGQRRGYVVRLAKQTASLRAALPDSGGYATFIQCWESGDFNLYLGELPLTPEQTDAFRKKYLQYDIFHLSGQKTLISQPTPENQDELTAILDEIFDDIDHFLEALGKQSTEK